MKRWRTPYEDTHINTLYSRHLIIDLGVNMNIVFVW